MGNRAEAIERIPPVPIENLQLVELPYGGLLRVERHENTEAGIVAYVGRHGDLWSMDQVRDQVKKIKGYGDTQIASDTGFDTIYRAQAGLTEKQAVEQGLAAAVDLMKRSYEGNGWRNDEVAAVVVATDAIPQNKIGIGLSYAAAVAKRADLGHLKETDIYDVCTACDGGARGLQEILNPNIHPELQGKKVILLAQSHVPDQFVEVPEEELPDHLDAFSLQVFSLGEVAIGVIPGETMTLMMGPADEHGWREPVAEYQEIEDKRGALAARTPFDSVFSPTDGLTKRVGNITYGRMPIPRTEGRENRRLDMRALAAAALFPREFRNVADPFLAKFRRLFPNGQFDEIIPHHPAIVTLVGALEKIESLFEKYGLRVPDCFWSNTDGNAPPAQTLMALSRRLKDLHNKNIWIASFGGGTTWSFFGIRLGKGGYDYDVVNGLKAS